MLRQALEGGYAVGYFEAWDLASLETVLDAAETERSPVVAGFGGMMVDADWLERRGVAMLGGAARAAAERCAVPVAVMFNEAQTEAQALAALETGYNCVLLATDGLAPEQAAEVTARLVKRAHAAGVGVEAELGQLPDAIAGEDHGGSLTDPVEAAAFVEATGIDCLAVSIGNVHVKSDGWATIDAARLEALSRAVNVPLAVHGGTSFPPEAVPHAVRHHAVKFNVGTALKKVYWEALWGHVRGLDGYPGGARLHELLGSRKAGDYTAAAREALTAKVRELMRLYGSSGRVGL
jgi:fructose/tagatose bisphosphate aldolase